MSCIRLGYLQQLSNLINCHIECQETVVESGLKCPDTGSKCKVLEAKSKSDWIKIRRL